jgi:MFS family permease
LPGVLGLAGIGFLVMLGFYLVPGQLGFLLQQKGLGDARAAGLAIACATAGSAASALNFGRLQAHLTPRTSTVATFGLIGLGLVLAAGAAQFWLVCAAMLLLGLGLGLCQPTLTGALLRRVPPAARGRAISRLTAGFFLGQFGSAGLSLLNPTGRTAALYLASGGVLMLLALLLLLLGARLAPWLAEAAAEPSARG